jgi:hypothetical protein
MSRSNLSKALWVSLMLGASVSVAWAQSGPGAAANENSMGNAGVRGSTMIDLSMPSVSDPAAVDMLFQEGNTIASILEGLKEKGFHIRYKEKQFLPSMTLLSLPTATRIDDVLSEILEPWDFRVYRSPLGHLVVTQTKKKKVANMPDENTRELLEHYKNVHHPEDDSSGRSEE